MAVTKIKETMHLREFWNDTKFIWGMILGSLSTSILIKLVRLIVN